MLNLELLEVVLFCFAKASLWFQNYMMHLIAGLQGLFKWNVVCRFERHSVITDTSADRCVCLSLNFLISDAVSGFSFTVIQLVNMSLSSECQVFAF